MQTVRRHPEEVDCPEAKFSSLKIIALPSLSSLTDLINNSSICVVNDAATEFFFPVNVTRIRHRLLNNHDRRAGFFITAEYLESLASLSLVKCLIEFLFDSALLVPFIVYQSQKEKCLGVSIKIENLACRFYNYGMQCLEYKQLQIQANEQLIVRVKSTFCKLK